MSIIRPIVYHYIGIRHGFNITAGSSYFNTNDLYCISKNMKSQKCSSQTNFAQSQTAMQLC